ncbi:MAG TPA: S4 domain-containing protein [Abditibacteriaceae bacterium]|jgi:ribosomal 50S subunit-recycling heat shock protein
MRLDLFLKQTGIVKRRPIAKLLCDGGKISRNGQVAKAGDEVRTGDALRLDFGTKIVSFEILGVPTGSVAKADRENFYHVTGEEKIDDEW